MSIRDRIRQIHVQMREHVLTPQQARTFETTLTGLLGNVTDEVLDADHAYRQVFLAAFEREKKQNAARVYADASDEGKRLTEARATEKLVMEMIRTCRSTLKSLDGEMRLAR